MSVVCTRLLITRLSLGGSFRIHPASCTDFRRCLCVEIFIILESQSEKLWHQNYKLRHQNYKLRPQNYKLRPQNYKLRVQNLQV